MSKEPEQKWTAQKLLELIKVKYPGPAWACFGEVRNATGFSRQVRTADAVAMSLYPSRGLELYGFEIKVSRSDWRKELEDPSKADEIARFCHRWYIVAPPGVVPRSELPPAWGLLEPSGGGPLRVKSRAELLEAQPPTLSFVASLVRKAGEWTDDRLEGMVPAGSIEEQVQKRLVAEKLRMRTEFGRAPGDLARLRDRVRAFEQASGVPFGEVWQTPQEMGKLYQIAHLIHDLERGRAFLDHCKAQLEGSAQRIGEMRKELSRMVSEPGNGVLPVPDWMRDRMQDEINERARQRAEPKEDEVDETDG